MVKNDVSFILLFVILMVKMWIFGFSPGVCPMEPSYLVFSLRCLVSNEIRALLGGIRLGGSATKSDRFLKVEGVKNLISIFLSLAVATSCPIYKAFYIRQESKLCNIWPTIFNNCNTNLILLDLWWNILSNNHKFTNTNNIK